MIADIPKQVLKKEPVESSTKKQKEIEANFSEKVFDLRLGRENRVDAVEISHASGHLSKAR
jgi:hypothetical protein